MTTSAYALVARIRERELVTRLALAAFIGLVAWMFTRSLWPLGWFLAVLIVQTLDWAVFRPFRRHPPKQLGPGYRAVCCAMTSLSVVVYSGITAFLWFQGGEVGKVFAMMQAAGGMLHVSLHMNYSRALLLSAVIPHAAYLLGLPVISVLMGAPYELLLVSLGGLLYSAHLVVAVRQSLATTIALRSATNEARQERMRAEIASEAKSNFLAVISHEIRTPMNAVISAAHLLRRTPLTEEQDEYVTILLDGGDMLVGLLNDVLDFSKIEAGKMQLESVVFDLHDKMEGLARLWRPRAEASDVALHLHISPDAPRLIRADPLRFQQIVFNLVSNAVKFTRKGRIDLTVDWDAQTQRVKISVRDTGCGIASAHLARVFELFEQVDAGTTRRYGGSGLGLAISRRLAQIMGGELTAESREGEGSLFCLSLPVEAVEADETSIGPQYEQLESLAGLSVLLADDHEANRRIMTLVLGPHGCRLTMAVNGAEAVALAQDETFDLILMDMQMPVMDGLEASRRIRSEGANVQTPIIAVTANALDVHRQAWAAVGVDHFQSKPIDPAQLVKLMVQAARGD